MIELKIDNIDIKVPHGTTIFEAAKSVGIEIPTMCYKKGYTNHPSCMICIVKERKTGKTITSCSTVVVDNMDIISFDEEIKNTRKESLELLLSDHVGDCEAPCRIACPAFMDIPLMNRLIASNKFDEALRIVKQEIALPLILGYICSAPCEKVCRRKQHDKSVSICLLKRFVANEDASDKNFYLPEKDTNTNKNVAIVGTGPAGLASAFYLLKWGYNCTLFDKNNKAGGAIRYKISENEIPQTAIDFEINVLKKYGAKFKLNTNITKENYLDLKNSFDAVIFASGSFNENNIKDFGFEYSKNGISVNRNTYETNQTGVFACGNIIRTQKMAVRAVAQGKSAAWSVNLFLKSKEVKQRHKKFNSKFGKLQESEIKEYMKETISDNRIEPVNGLLAGFTKQEVITEATRCMRCDCRKPNTCKLRIYSDQYNADRRRFLYGERKTLRKVFNHEIIVYEPEKCIKCNLCVEIATKNKEIIGLTSVGRGFDVQIDAPFSISLEKALKISAKECADNCPTAALSLK